jgi:hypothetical protein
MDRGQGNWKNVKSIEIEQKKTVLHADLTGHIESKDIMRLAGAAAKIVDEERNIKTIDSVVTDA